VTNSSYSQQSTLGETSNGFSHRWAFWRPQIFFTSENFIKDSWTTPHPVSQLLPVAPSCFKPLSGLGLTWDWMGWAQQAQVLRPRMTHHYLWESICSMSCYDIYGRFMVILYSMAGKTGFFWCTLNQRCSLIVPWTPLLSILQPNSQAVVDWVCCYLLASMRQLEHCSTPLSNKSITFSQFLSPNFSTVPCPVLHPLSIHLCPQFIFVLVIHFVLIQLSSSDYNSLTLSPCLQSWGLGPWCFILEIEYTPMIV